MKAWTEQPDTVRLTIEMTLHEAYDLKAYLQNGPDGTDHIRRPLFEALYQIVPDHFTRSTE